MSRVREIAQALTIAGERVTYTPDERVRYRTQRGTLKSGAPRMVSVPGVTTVLGTCVAKPNLVWWSAKCAVEHIRDMTAEGVPLNEALLQSAYRAHTVKRDAGAETGTIAHSAIHAWLTGDPFDTYLPEEPEARNATLAALAWVRDAAPQIIGAEVTVVDPADDPGWAGTTDLVAFVDGKLSVIDWKSTRKGLFRETPLQLAAYAHAVEHVLQTHGLGRVEQTIAVHVCRERAVPTPLVRGREEWMADAAAFLAGAQIYQHLKVVERAISALEYKPEAGAAA